MSAIERRKQGSKRTSNNDIGPPCATTITLSGQMAPLIRHVVVLIVVRGYEMCVKPTTNVGLGEEVLFFLSLFFFSMREPHFEQDIFIYG